MGVDHHWMSYAYALAQKAGAMGEVPVGAVVVSEDNYVLGEGFNQVIALNDPTAHAEVLAVRMAAIKINNYRLNNAVVYVTLEPCCMCAGALIHARIRRLVYATRDIKTGACGSCYQLLSGESLNHKVIIDEGVLQKECAVLLTNFFKMRR